MVTRWLRTLAQVAWCADANRPGGGLPCLLPESDGRTRQVHAYWAPRCEAETLAAVAAGLQEIPYDAIARATVRSRLGISGKLDIAANAEPPHGRYWKPACPGSLFAARALVRRGPWPQDHGRSAVIREGRCTVPLKGENRTYPAYTSLCEIPGGSQAFIHLGFHVGYGVNTAFRRPTSALAGRTPSAFAEPRILRQLDHPHIVKIAEAHSLTVTWSTPSPMVMPYYSAGSLYDQDRRW